MRKWQYKSTILFILLTLVLLIPTSVYAWVVYVEKKSLATFDGGDISLVIQANNQTFTTDLTLNDLSYVDFTTDFLMDTTNTLSSMASSVKLSFNVTHDSVPLKNLITLTNINPGLLYLIMIEGINLDPTHEINTNYHALIVSITQGLSTELEKRDAITAYNATVLNQIYQTRLVANDRFLIQLVFWGDYQTTTNIQTEFNLTLTIDTIQFKGELS